MSVFTDIKKKLGVIDEDATFDSDILMDINLAMGILYQVGACDVVTEVDKNTEWEGLFNDESILPIAKDYIYMQVRIIFDGNSLNSSTLKAFEEKSKEYEWRIYAVNNKKE